MGKHRAPAQHSLEDIAFVNDAEDLLKRARSAAAMAAVTGSVGSTDSWSLRKLDGTVETKPDVKVEAIDQIENELNRRFGVKSWGPAYRVSIDTHDTGVVIVLPRRGSTTHAA